MPHPQLDDLVLTWVEARDRGQTLTPEALCADCPNLLGPLRARIAALVAMSWLDDPDDLDSDDQLSLPDLASVSRAGRSSRSPEAIPWDQLQIPAVTFEHTLADTGLLSPGEVQAFLHDRSGGQRFGTAAELARELLRHGKLTAFQLGMIARGKGKDLVLGNYLLLDRIGAGGMGRVFKAHHRRMKRVVAVKLLPEELVNSADAIERFHREFEAAAKLEHPHIVAAFDAGEANGQHFLAMQYVEGQDLATLVRRRGPLPVGQAIHCLIQAARGLEYAHRRGIVHRDVKPSNLLADTEGTVKVLDLGLARLQPNGGQVEAVKADLTREGVVMGTVDYMAPEQALDTHSADRRSDVYGLGCTLWFLLMDRPVFDGGTLMAKMLAHREQPVPSLREARPEVPACLDDIFQKMVAKKPEDRFPTMTALLAELTACAEMAEKITATPGGLLHLTLSPDEEAARDTSSAAFSPTDSHGPPPPASPPVKAKPRPRRLLPFGVLAVTVGLGSLLVLAGVITTLKTSEGTITIDLEGKPIPVTVNQDQTLTITDPNDGKPIHVKIEKGKKLLTLTKEGFEALVLEFNLTTKDGRKLSARFVSAVEEVAPNDPDASRLRWVHPAGQFLYLGEGLWIEYQPIGNTWRNYREHIVHKEYIELIAENQPDLHVRLGAESAETLDPKTKQFTEMAKGQWVPVERKKWIFLGGELERQKDGSWIEFQPGVRRTFREVTRNRDYVQLFPLTGTDIELRLYPRLCTWKHPKIKDFEYRSPGNWEGWNIEVMPNAPPVKQAAAVERAVAEWALSKGGIILIGWGDKKGAGAYFKPGEKLPEETFILVSLDLNQAKDISDDDLARVQGLPHLAYLNLSNLPIGDAALGHLKDLPLLQGVFLDRTRVTDAGLKSLHAFPTLTQVLLEDTKVTAEGMRELKKALPKCEVKGTPLPPR